MSRIVITCWGSYGDVYPYVGLAKALKERGHQTLIAAPDYYRRTIEQEQIEFAPVGLDIDPADREVMARVMHPVKGTEAVVRDLVMPALRQTYDELRQAAVGADLLVSHPLTLAAPLVAETQGLPWVSTVLAPLGFFSVTDLPVLPPMPGLVHLRGLGPWFGRTGGRPRAPRDARMDGAGLSVSRRVGAVPRRASSVRRAVLAGDDAGAVLAGVGRAAGRLATARARDGIRVLQRTRRPGPGARIVPRRWPAAGGLHARHVGGRRGRTLLPRERGRGVTPRRPGGAA